MKNKIYKSINVKFDTENEKKYIEYFEKIKIKKELKRLIDKELKKGSDKR